MSVCVCVCVRLCVCVCVCLCVCACVASEVTIVMLSCKSSLLVLANTNGAVPLHKTMPDLPKLHSLTHSAHTTVHRSRACHLCT